MLSVTHGNPSLEEISLSDEQFWPIYPSLAEIPPVTDSTSDVCRDPSLMECTVYSWNVQVLYGSSQFERSWTVAGQANTPTCCQGKLSRERVSQVVWWAREARECPPSI